MAKAVLEIRSLARLHTRSCIAVLIAVARKRNAPEAARVAAAKELLDRGWGKAVQPIAMPEGITNLNIIMVPYKENAELECDEIEKMIDITPTPAGLIIPPKTNGHGGNGHG